MNDVPTQWYQIKTLRHVLLYVPNPLHAVGIL